MKSNNKKLFVIILAAFFLATGYNIHAQEVITFEDTQPNKMVDITVIESTPNVYRARVKINGLLNIPIWQNGKQYHIISIGDEYGSLDQLGAPDFPIIQQLVGLPQGASYNVSLSNESYKTIRLGYIYPAQKMLMESDDQNHFYRNEYVNQDDFIPDSLFVIGGYEYRGVEGVNICVCPFKYSFRSETLTIMTDFTINVEFNYVSLPSNNSYDKMFNNKLNIFDNCNSILDYNKQKELVSLNDSVRYDYLVLVGNMPGITECNALSKYIKWKSMKGFRTKMSYISDIGNTCQQIKNYISQEYLKGIGYVLLVGNASFIPAREIKPKNKTVTSDYWYGCMGDSTDYIADISVGRFPVRDTVDLATMVNKTISYETLKNDSCGKVLLVANKQDAPGWFQGCMEEIRTSAYNYSMQFSKAYGAADSLGGNQASNADVVNAINSGLNIVNYRGHGNKDVWGGWNVYEENFDSACIIHLSPASNPIVFSIACLTSNINREPCLMERFMQSVNGSVAYVGATESTWNPANNNYNKKIFNKLLNDNIYNLGDMNNAALIENKITHPTSANYIDNTFCYLIGGDPTLEILNTDTPSYIRPVISINNDNSVTIISTLYDYEISVVTESGELLGLISSCVGDCTVPAPTQNVWITLNKHNHVPYTFYVNIEDSYIQNKNISFDSFYLHDNVSIGSNVCDEMSEGPVVVSQGRSLYIKKCGLLSRDVEVQLGGSLIVN